MNSTVTPRMAPSDIIAGQFTDNVNNYQLVEAIRFTTGRLKRLHAHGRCRHL